MGKSNHIIQKVDDWLDANIDSLFMNLDNKQKYLKAVGVRGHR